VAAASKRERASDAKLSKDGDEDGDGGQASANASSTATTDHGAGAVDRGRFERRCVEAQTSPVALIPNNDGNARKFELRGCARAQGSQV
jgi:hypothetical protein